MKILADVRLLSKGGVSGIEEYTRNLLRALFAIDKENEYALFYNGFRKETLGQIANSTARIIDWKIPNKLFDLSSRFLGVPAIDRLIDADLVFSPHFNILKTAHAPRVITFHDLSFLHHPYFFSQKQRFWHWLQDIQKQATRAARIIAMSEFTKGDLVNLLGVPPEKIDVVYSGISEEFQSSPSTSLSAGQAGSGTKNLLFAERSRGVTIDRPYFLYLGTLEPRKNVPAIIRAFNILKHEKALADWQLVIAGKPGWLYHQILREAARSPYTKDIIFTGQVGTKDRALLYNLAKVFVYPSFFEGFGFPPLEAQASGCPVVASDRTSLPEVLGDSALLVDPWKVEALAAAMRQAALDPATRKRLIRAGAENARRFTWEKAAEKTLAVFNNVR